MGKNMRQLIQSTAGRAAGALGMAQKTVSEVMVKLETACTLSPKDRAMSLLLSAKRTQSTQCSQVSYEQNGSIKN